MIIKFFLKSLFPSILFFLIPLKNNFFFEDNKNLIEFELSFYKSQESYNVDNILDKEFKSFPKSQNFGIANGTYWFKLTFKETTSTSNLIGYIPTHNIHNIDIYVQQKSGIQYVSSVGNHVKETNLVVGSQFPSFIIDLEADKKTTYFLKVNFIKEANFPIKIFEENEFFSYISNKKTFNSLYYGSCLIVVLLNLFFFVKLKDKTYLFYALFLLSLMVKLFMYDGSLINLFRGIDFYHSLELIIHISNEIFFLLFSIKFLNLDKKNPLAIKIFFLFPITLLVLYACYFYSKNFTFIAIADTLGVLLFPILWFYGIHKMKKVTHARFYVFGYFLLVPLAVFFIIGYSFGFWKVHGDMVIVKIASWLDIIVFTYAISYRMNSKIRKDNENLLELKQMLEDTKIINIKNTSSSNPYFSLLSENDISRKPLTLREIDILIYLNEDYNNRDISEKLFISSNTVKSHIRNIYSKLNVNNRNELKEKTSPISI